MQGQVCKDMSAVCIAVHVDLIVFVALCMHTWPMCHGTVVPDADLKGR